MLAAIGVILGLLPTILSMVGLSVIETGVLALRQHFFAFLLALSSPAALPSRTLDYRNSKELLQQRLLCYRLKADAMFTVHRRVLPGLQYVLATAAVANLAHVTWELFTKTVTANSAVTKYLPGLWVATSVVIHVNDAWAVRLRISITAQQILSSRMEDQCSTVTSDTPPQVRNTALYSRLLARVY